MGARVTFVCGVAAIAIGCATSGTGGTVGGDDTGDAGGVTPGDDAGAPDVATRHDSSVPPGDSGMPPADSGGPLPDTGSTCVMPPPATCGLAPQCGCSATQTCDVVTAMGGTSCVMAGTAAQAHACTTTGGCAAGLTCVFGACRPYCATAGAQCGLAGTGICYQVQTNATPPENVPNLKVCLLDCALDDPNSCGGLPTNTSDPVASCLADNSGHSDCETAGRSTTTCGGNMAPFCAPGYTCANNGTSNVCVKYCKITGGTCPGAQTCHHFATDVVVGAITYGYCQ